MLIALAIGVSCLGIFTAFYYHYLRSSSPREGVLDWKVDALASIVRSQSEALHLMKKASQQASQRQAEDWLYIDPPTWEWPDR